MRFTVLNENTAGKRGFLAEHGLSVLIVHQGRKLLFDTGQTDVFLHNAEKIGETLSDLDGISGKTEEAASCLCAENSLLK